MTTDVKQLTTDKGQLTNIVRLSVNSQMLDVSSQKKGFSMIELLLVIAILGVLAAVILTTIDPRRSVGLAHDAQRKSDLSALSKAAEIYYAENFRTLPATGTFVSNNESVANPTDASGNGWIPQNLTNQTKVLPIDPNNDATHFYRYCGDSTQYSVNFELDALLEYDSSAMENDGGDDPARYETGTNKTQC